MMLMTVIINKCVFNALNRSVRRACVRLNALYIKRYKRTQPNVLYLYLTLICKHVTNNYDYCY